MKKTMALFGLLIMAVLTTAASCSHTMIASLGDINNDFSYTEIQEQQIDFANKTRLDLSNDAGEITINGWDQPYIQMVATIRAKSNVACFVLDKDEFRQVIDKSDSFEQEIRKAVFERQ